MEGIFLGVDYGEKNTGLAFGRAGFAFPLRVISSRKDDFVISEIIRVAAENRITKIIIGLPLTAEGKETAQATKVRRFAKLLKAKLKKPVEFVSEFDTSNEAMTGAIKSGFSKKRRKTNDHLSAALILKRYFGKVEDKKS